MAEFIFMLTKDDQTVADAPSVYRGIRAAPLRYVGFKDIGQPTAVLGDLAKAIRDDGRVAVLEVVSIDSDSELRSVEAGLALGVGILMGGTHPDDVLPLLEGSGIAYFPFPGTVVGHPSRLSGRLEEIAEHGRTLTARPGVAGLDLLAYRHEGDVPRLIELVVQAASGRVVVAGSIDRPERIDVVTRAGSWGFTVGGAVFDRAFVPGGTLLAQVEAILERAAQAPG